MSRRVTAWMAGAIILLFIQIIPAGATVLFQEDFESGLSAWTGKNGGAHHGVIVADPLSATDNHALSFTALNSAGDIFTTDTFFSATGNYMLIFDYLGVNTGAAGFAGFSQGTPGMHTWLAGSTTYPGASLIPDTNTWEHIELSFNTPWEFHIMLEDFGAGAKLTGDALFDNIRLTDGQPDTTVPEPATLLLVGTALAGFAWRRQGRGRKH